MTPFSPRFGDGGIETALEERLGQTLPEFAAYVLLDTEAGREALREYYRPYLALAASEGLPMLIDTATWRANPDWIALVEGTRETEGDRVSAAANAERLMSVNRAAVALLRELIAEVAPQASIGVNGVVGPRFDEYDAAERMSADEAEAYHGPQVRALADAGVDRVTSVTTLDAAEGIGVVRAARAAGVPVVVSFTVGADGRLADGSSLAEAIREVDTRTDRAAFGFGVNCAHPTEVLRGVDATAPETARLVGMRLNAARADDEGAGDAPEAFAAAMRELAAAVPQPVLLGGCCGTDTPHIAALAARPAV